MGPFPFIRFEQAEINGNFGDEHAYRNNYLMVLNAFFVNDYFVGDKFFIAVNFIKSEIAGANATPYFYNLKLVLPSPYPTSVGVEVYTLQITIEQQTDYLPSFIAITFDLTDGLVTSSTTVYTAGLTKLDSATNGPYIAEELKLAKTLSVYQQNGAAIFPDTFDFDATTGIAERRLVRAYDWKYNNATNQPQREGITDLQVIPKTVFRLRELSQNEKAMVSFFLEKPIKESLTNDDWNDTNIYLTPLLGDWQFDFITVSSSKKQLSISSSEYGISLILAGIKVSSKWYFQRFVDPVYISGTPPDLVTLLSTDSPASPNIGRLYYNASPLSSNYYDFDQCEFGTVVNEEPFNLIIKSGDTYQINIDSNYIFESVGPESDQAPLIGIFDCNYTYIQDIGELTSNFEKTLQWNIAINSFTNEYRNILDILVLVETYGSDIILYGGNEQYTGETPLITIPTAVFTGITTAVAFVNAIESYLNANGFPTSYTTETIMGETVYKFVTTAILLENGIIAKLSLDDTYFSFAIFGNTGGSQYKANITIPPLANGIYIIGIYNTYFVNETNYITLFATSQPLELNNFEDFTQMLEYGSAQDSIIEGFEYLNGWIQRIRVPLNGAGQTYSLEESIYRNSDGTFQKPQNSTDENISLHTDYLDLQTQRAMTSATRHPIFVLANQNLSVQGDLEIATNQDYTTNQSFRKLQQMRFQAKNQGYQPNNNSCLG
jgi:hypothetical protein